MYSDGVTIQDSSCSRASLVVSVSHVLYVTLFVFCLTPWGRHHISCFMRKQRAAHNDHDRARMEIRQSTQWSLLTTTAPADQGR
jgi:hypothetical protein